jgi:hypothetical protein
MMREMRGDGDITEDGDIAINNKKNAPCVMRQHGPKSVRL